MSPQAFDNKRVSDARVELDHRTEGARPTDLGATSSSDEGSVVQARAAAPHWRVAELERELAFTRESLANQRQEFDQDAASFNQAIARLSHSERALGQAKARLADAEDRLVKNEARIAELTRLLSEAEVARALSAGNPEQAAELELAREALARSTAALEIQDAELTRLRAALSAAEQQAARALAQEAALRELAEALSQDSSAGTAECARLCDSLKAAEEREKIALAAVHEREKLAHAAARSVELERRVHAEQLAEARQREDELAARNRELQEERDQALSRTLDLETALVARYEQLVAVRRELAHAAADRSRFIGVLGAIETLGREIAQMGFQAKAQAEARPSAENDDPDPERITLKPAPTASAPEKSLRSSTSPEILIDGLPLEPR